ncbi:hypothetical protein BC833DRAFT_626818, partial [Globomyces pollinis-pini]
DFVISLRVLNRQEPLRIPFTALTNLDPLSPQTFTLTWLDPLSRSNYPTGFTIALLLKQNDFPITTQIVEDSSKNQQATVIETTSGNVKESSPHQTLDIDGSFQEEIAEKLHVNSSRIDLQDTNLPPPKLNVYDVMNIKKPEYEFVCNPYYKDLGPLTLFENIAGKEFQVKNIKCRLDTLTNFSKRPHLEFDISDTQYKFLEDNRQLYKVVFTMARYLPRNKSFLQYIPSETWLTVNDDEVVRAAQDNYGDGYGINECIVDLFHFLQVGANEIYLVMQGFKKDLSDKYIISVRVLELLETPIVIPDFKRQSIKKQTSLNFVENKPIRKCSEAELKILRKQ